MRKNSDVITLVVKYSNIRLSKELDCILVFQDLAILNISMCFHRVVSPVIIV